MRASRVLPHSTTTSVVFFLSLAFGIPAYSLPPPQVTLPCNNRPFQNAYYLLTPPDFHKASNFYLSIPDHDSSGDHELKNVTGERLRTETFYDDEDRSLLKSGAELSSSVIESLADYEAERETVVFIDHTIKPIERSTFVVRHYNRRATKLDKHPLFGKIKRSDRAPLIDKIASRANMHAQEDLQAALTIEHHGLSQLYRYFGIAYGAISLEEVNIKIFGMNKPYVVLKFELLQDKIQTLTNRELGDLSNVLCRNEVAFKQQYPEIPSFPWLGYSTYMKLADEALPHRSFFRKYPLLYKLGQILLLGFFGLLVLCLLLGRHSLPDHHRRSVKPGKN